MLTSGGLGTMGYGFPAAIGAQLGRPKETVVCIEGDGSFQMTMTELATAAYNKVPVKAFILDNGYYGMVRQWQELFYTRNYSGTPLSSPDFVKIAEAHGLTGILVSKRSEIENAVRQARETEGSVVLEFKIEEEDLVYPMVPTGAALHEMIRRPEMIP